MGQKSWKDFASNATSRIKQNVRDNTIGKVEQKGKDIANNSKLVQFAKSKDKKEFLKNGIASKIKGYEAYKKAQQVIATVQKAVTFIVSNIKVIAIVSAVVILSYNLAIIGISIAQTIGKSPHYYCEIEADSIIKKSVLYKQYCTNGKSEFELGELNGHYIVQDGSYPCTCSSVLNLLLRYYTGQGVNFYDYLWDETGQYDAEMLANTSYENLTGVSVRGVTNGNVSGSTDNRKSSSGRKYGSEDFALNNGKVNYNMPNWGYLRDESLDYSDVDIEAELPNNENNENWVWDLSLENRGPKTSWAATFSGLYEVDGKKVNMIWVTDNNWTTAEELKDILDDNPFGIVAYKHYVGDGYESDHAIVITGYRVNPETNKDEFFVIDPGLGMTGGFEGPHTSANFVLDMWRGENLTNGSGLHGYMIVEPVL